MHNSGTFECPRAHYNEIQDDLFYTRQERDIFREKIRRIRTEVLGIAYVSNDPQLFKVLGRISAILDGGNVDETIQNNV